MKKISLQLLTPDPGGPTFAKVITTADQMAIQEYAHDHLTRVVKDMLVAGAEAAQVAGFAATLTEGLGVEIAAGNAIDEDGVHYQLDAAVEKMLGPADPANPRTDLIYGTLSIDADAEIELQPFRRLRTQAELEANLEPYPPTQYSIPTEKHTKLTVNVRAGVPAADPDPPALNAGEVPLWHVRVDAGETDLEAGDLTDVRVQMESLYALSQRVSQAGLQEIVQDIVGAILGAPDGSITVTYNDVANTLTLAVNTITEKVQDIIGALVSDTSTIDVTYDDASNTFTIVLAAAYKALLDEATSAATANKLMKRDANADAAVRDIKPTRQVLFSDSSIHRAAFPREFFYSIVDLDAPLAFHGAVAGTYETVKKTGVATSTNGVGEPVATVKPEIEIYLDPSDFANVNCCFEVTALHTGAGGDATWGSTVQLYNASDSAEVANLGFTWLEHGATAPLTKRSTVFTFSGSGYKRLVLRARNDNDVTNASLKLWRVRLIINPSF